MNESPLRVAVGLVALLAASAVVSPGGYGAEDAFDWVKERQFWSFRAPLCAERRVVRHETWPRQPLDYPVLAKLEAEGVDPAPESGWRTLIRRVAMDVTGVPLEPAEAEEFLSTPSEAKYEALVERLLASPRYGERMASMWLPLARYGEDQAHQVGDDTSMAYPNAWRYRDWVIGAFNRDIPYDRFITLQLASDLVEGTGGADEAALGFLGLGPKYYDRGRLSVMAEEWEDRVDTVSRTMLGLTVGCARCHDHKLEPISTEDYYAFAGVFASTRMVNMRPDGKEEAKGVKADKMDPGTMHVVAEDKVQDLPVFMRGNPETKGKTVPRRFLRILSSNEPELFAEGSGRLELARSIADPGNPLTARVIVNRVWGMLFGRGIVTTPSNLGESGMQPSDQALLDDLAVRFVANGWSIKQLMREIVLSATYRQGSNATGKAMAADPQNRLISRQNRRRLTFEQWRDSVLLATGELDMSGGRSVELSDKTNLRRTVYSRVSRLELNEVLLHFDYPDANVHAEKRGATTTALQKLYLLNSGFMMERSKALAERGLKEAGSEQAAVVDWMYRRLYGRPPEAEETRLGTAFLGRRSDGGADVTLERLSMYAQVLLAANEMLYVD